jgi:hypothetical protein
MDVGSTGKMVGGTAYQGSIKLATDLLTSYIGVNGLAEPETCKMKVRR